jgi:hypothetical protein
MLKRTSLALCLVTLAAIPVLAFRANAQAIKTYVVTNSGAAAYRIDGAATNNPTLTLYRGLTYKFDWNATNPAHPFFIDNVGLNDSTSAHYANGATGVTETPGLLTFVVPASAPATLFYQCSIHDAMSGTILITDPPPVPAVGTVAIVCLAVLVLAVGYLARRRRGST